MTSHENIEVAKFLQQHAKNIKLTKEEYNYLDNLIFTRNSPTKKSISLFPRATPLPFGSTPSTTFKQSYFPASALKTSRKRLEIFDYNLISENYSIESAKNVNVDVADKSFDELERNNHGISDRNTKTLSPPRQMTDAAKELMASISINFELPIDSIENLTETNNDTISLKFPENNSKFPIQKLDFDKKEEIYCQNSEKIFGSSPKFDFNISEFEETDRISVPEQILPSFFFQID